MRYKINENLTNGKYNLLFENRSDLLKKINKILNKRFKTNCKNNKKVSRQIFFNSII